MKFVFTSDAGISSMTWSSDLASVRDAKIEAVRTLGELLSDDGPQFWKSHAVEMTVCDGTGLKLFRLKLVATDCSLADEDGTVGS
ncbi:hypothetical protein ABIC32_001418 [Brevundimonas sp. 1080]|uniref:DUF6894 family protein n=1 Tax=Brevundimonas sp. 1080 TaxID=3156405 RepID=UPI0033924611